jgi:metal-dependent amidase/aminoacylase/carboxypeptidase family protein
MPRISLGAHPVREKTALPYATTVTAKYPWGVERPVMHACAHDMHATCLLAASAMLYTAKEYWFGTLFVLFQPNGECLGGTKAMLDDGLYDKISVPDIVLAQHIVPLMAVSVALSAAPVLAAADSIDIRIKSTGPGVNPQDNIDPILFVAKILIRIKGEVTVLEKARVLACRQLRDRWPGTDYRSHADMNIDLEGSTWERGKKLLMRSRRLLRIVCKFR